MGTGSFHVVAGGEAGLQEFLTGSAGSTVVSITPAGGFQTFGPVTQSVSPTAELKVPPQDERVFHVVLETP